MNILDAVSIRLPCNACGQTYEVPLRDVLLSHTVVRCGCPATQETECPPVFQVRLFDREPIEALSSAWERLASQWKTMPVCESVNARKAPTANSGIRRSVTPPNRINITAASAASTYTPWE